MNISPHLAIEKAHERAKEELSSKGILDPHLTMKSTLSEFYEASKAYSERLSALTIHYLRMPSGDRPLEPISPSGKNGPTVRKPRTVQTHPTAKPSGKTFTKDKWGLPYYDD